jgi:hypothetical protein
MKHVYTGYTFPDILRLLYNQTNESEWPKKSYAMSREAPIM